MLAETSQNMKLWEVSYWLEVPVAEMSPKCPGWPQNQTFERECPHWSPLTWVRDEPTLNNSHGTSPFIMDGNMIPVTEVDCAPKGNGAAGKNRTYGPALTKGVLYP